MDYRVEWSIDVEASSPAEAAMKARAAQIAPGTMAVVFDVHSGNPQGPERVDLLELAQAGRYAEVQLAYETPLVYRCTGCGREESVCSADPCPAVIADRES